MNCLSRGWLRDLPSSKSSHISKKMSGHEKNQSLRRRGGITVFDFGIRLDSESFIVSVRVILLHVETLGCVQLQLKLYFLRLLKKI